MADHIVYQNTAESLLRFLRHENRLSPALREQLKSAGLDPDAPSDLPRDVWVGVLRVTVAAAYPTLSSDEGQRRVGQGIIHTFFLSMVGKVLFTTLRVMGVKRALTRLTTSFRSANSYTQASFAEVSETEGTVWVSDVNEAPGYIQGVLEEALKFAGAVNPTVTPIGRDGASCTYQVRWS